MTATEWATIASLTTAVGILILAVATFASVRSSGAVKGLNVPADSVHFGDLADWPAGRT